MSGIPSLLMVLALAGAPDGCGPAPSDSVTGPVSVLVFAGRAAPTTFAQIIVRPWTTEFTDLYVLGGAVSKHLGLLSDFTGSWGESLSVEVETGAGFRFGEEVRGEGWGALYLRFGHFPWNGRIHTTVATSLGLSLLTSSSMDFVKGEDTVSTAQEASLLMRRLREDLLNIRPSSAGEFDLTYVSEAKQRSVKFKPDSGSIDVTEQAADAAAGGQGKRLSFYVSDADKAEVRLVYTYLPDEKTIKRKIADNPEKSYAVPRLKDFAIDFLSGIRNETDIFQELLKTRRLYAAALKQAGEFEKKLEKDNIETLLLKGIRTPGINRDEFIMKIGIIDSI